MWCCVLDQITSKQLLKVKHAGFHKWLLRERLLCCPATVNVHLSIWLLPASSKKQNKTAFNIKIKV